MISKTKTGTKASAAEYYSRPQQHIMLTNKGPIGKTPISAAMKDMLAKIAKPESK
jgi:hypothetical protein